MIILPARYNVLVLFAAEVLGAPILFDIDNSTQPVVYSKAPLDKVRLHQAEIASTTRNLNINFPGIDVENLTTPTIVGNATNIGYNLTGQQYQIDNSSTAYSSEAKELALAEIDEELVDVEALKAKIKVLQMYLAQALNYTIKIEDHDGIRNASVELDFVSSKVLEPSEEYLRSLEERISNVSIELEDHLLANVDIAIEDYGTAIKETEQKIEMIEKEMTELLARMAIDPKKDEVNEVPIFEEIFIDVPEESKSEFQNVEDQYYYKNYQAEHAKSHKEEKLEDVVGDNTTFSTTFSALNSCLFPGLSLLVLLVTCLAIIHLMWFRKKSSEGISSGMSRNRGYAPLLDTKDQGGKTWGSEQVKWH